MSADEISKSARDRITSSSKRSQSDEDEDYKPPSATPADGETRTRKRVRWGASPANSSSKKKRPNPTDSSTWRESDVPAEQGTTKGDATKQYRLQPKDFASLRPPHREMTKSGYIALLYLERDVERKAWEKYGGPECWEARLKELREQYGKKYPGKPFIRPRDYSALPSITIESLSPGPSRPQRLSPRETQLKFEFRQMFGGDWVWDTANRLLTNSEYYADHMNDRLELLRMALRNGPLRPLPSYPRRPATLPSSGQMAALREVLANVPETPDEPPDCRNVPTGLEYHHIAWPEDDSWYDWNDATFDDVYRALTRVVRELGVEAWKAARWEVYDRYSRCIFGIQVVRDGRNKWWDDSAYFWLSGREKETRGGIDYNRRVKTPAGKEYNEALPLLSYGE